MCSNLAVLRLQCQDGFLEAPHAQKIFFARNERSPQCLRGVAKSCHFQTSESAALEPRSNFLKTVRLCGADWVDAGGAVCKPPARHQIVFIRETLWHSAAAGTLR